MSQQILAKVEASSLKSEVPQFAIGDTVDVHTRILEGEKERIQIFNGVVIAKSGAGTREPALQGELSLANHVVADATAGLTRCVICAHQGREALIRHADGRHAAHSGVVQ